MQAEEEFVTIFATCHFQELSRICGLSKLEACKLVYHRFKDAARRNETLFFFFIVFFIVVKVT